MKEKTFPYIMPPEEAQAPFLDESLDLMSVYAHCTAELTLQQSKRDQLIAFYLTITGLVATYLFSASLSPAVRSLIFLGLFVIGCMWLTVILRYRIYKEVYWLACRTITCLHSIDRSCIDKARLQHTFYAVMVKCAKGIPLDAGGKPRLWAYVWKNHTSAEYIMFMTLALLAGLCGALGLALLLPWGWLSYMLAAVLLIAFLLLQTRHYNDALISLHAVTRDHLDSSFNRAFAKAWQIHFF